jgi:MFS family permease
LSIESPVTPAPAGYLALLKGNPNFRWLWAGEVISLFGDWFNLIASAALIAELTASGLAVGSLFVVRMLAPFLVSPLAGVVVDRYNRKYILIASDLLRAGIVLCFLLVRQAHLAWLLYVLTFLHLGISGFFIPARSAILPDIVARHEIGAANALGSATWSTMLAFGAALGGLFTGRLGIYPAFIVDAFTFLCSALCVARVTYHHRPTSSDGLHFMAALQQYLDGIRYLRSHRDMLAISLHKGALALTIGGVFQVIQVALARQVFVLGQGGSSSLGLFYAVAGIGTGLGPLAARRFTRDRQGALRVALALSYLFAVLGLLICAPLVNFGWFLLGTLIREIGGGINWVFSSQLLLENLPDQVRGRVFSTEFALFTLADAASAAAGGWLLDHTSLSLSELIWWLAGLTIIPCLLWLLWLSFGLRNESQPADV